MTFNEAAKMTEEQARQKLEQIRWGGEPVCSHCGSRKVTVLDNASSGDHKRRAGLYQCNICRKQFTVTTGTIFEGSHLPLRTWIQAFSLLCASKKGMSAHQLHRMLGITYKTSWFMCHRIRAAMTQEPLRSMLAGTVEADETYVGGKPSNQKKLMGRDWNYNKTPVAVLVEKDGRARVKVLRSVSHRRLKPFLADNVQPGAQLHTDESAAYTGFGRTYHHSTVNHMRLEFARGMVTTNHAENFFSLLKRGIIGSFHHVSPWHLERYANEFAFRYSYRKTDDDERTIRALRQTEGLRLMYKPLKRKAA